MFDFIKIFTNLFKGFPFWFGGADEELEKNKSDWKYLTDTDQWHLPINKETKDVVFYYKGMGTMIKDNKFWHNLN